MVTLMVLSGLVVSKEENARRKQLKDDYLRAKQAASAAPIAGIW